MHVNVYKCLLYIQYALQRVSASLMAFLMEMHSEGGLHRHHIVTRMICFYNLRLYVDIFSTVH